MTAVALLLAGAGVVLVWTAVTGDDPRDVVRGVFDPKHKPAGSAGVRSPSTGGTSGAGAAGAAAGGAAGTMPPPAGTGGAGGAGGSW